MMHCTNCGQINTETSQFCRFCGTKFIQHQQQQQQQQSLPPEGFEYAPPRPYSWKTDEFQVSDNQRPRPINQVQPLPNPYATHQSARPQPLVHQQPQNVAHGYRCPRCASQMPPQFVKRISTAGWITFAVLMVFFFPLFWIGLLIKEDVRVCPACKLNLG